MINSAEKQKRRIIISVILRNEINNYLNNNYLNNKQGRQKTKL